MKIILLILLAQPVLAENGSGSALGGLPFLIIMFVLMYLLLIRPQQKRAKEHKLMLQDLQVGNEVVTNGGILAKVKKIDDNFAMIEIAKNIVVKVQKQSINQRLPKGSIAEQEANKQISKKTSK